MLQSYFGQKKYLDFKKYYEISSGFNPIFSAKFHQYKFVGPIYNRQQLYSFFKFLFD